MNCKPPTWKVKMKVLLSTSQRQAIIKRIEKKDRDKRYTNSLC